MYFIYSTKTLDLQLSYIRWYSIKKPVICNDNKKLAYSKDLVIWGTNLYSTVGSRFTQNELNMVKLPYFIKSVMIGLLLSDGYINFYGKRSKNGSLGLTQSLAHSGYL